MSLELSPESGRAAAFRALRDAFRAVGLATPDLDARVLVCAALDITAEDLARDPDMAIGAVGAGRIAEMASRRAAREPVARIVGRREFFGHDFAVGPATLVPRPDTEILVEAVLEALAADGAGEAPVAIADLGTGTGCIVVSLVAALAGATGVGVDLAPEAVEIARRNADAAGVGGRTRFVAGDFAVAAGGEFDVVVSNPPYIETEAIAGLDPEVAAHDPHLALDGGPDGLEAYRRIVALAPEMLKPQGLLCFEVGLGQAGEVGRLMAEAGFAGIEVRRDLGGVGRVVLGRPGARK
ncbi:MAG TPA: peptide chain release factor N(5)-glutamine methyltransferase [Hyphomicrobiales bacterium]|nr:peptide chain release factor N(5)-glutamine methyltransferase [Hyphomicrobiales bacterium]